MKKILFVVMFCLCLCGCGTKNDSFSNLNIETVKSKIGAIDGITDICVVTEDNDPNGQLNKEKGYTGALFFTFDSIELNNDAETNNSCEKGTTAGGSIEIYANRDDAKDRNDYLSNFDGSILASYHKLKETIVIRLSEKLTVAEQEKLSSEIIKKLEDTTR